MVFMELTLRLCWFSNVWSGQNPKHCQPCPKLQVFLATSFMAYWRLGKARPRRIDGLDHQSRAFTMRCLDCEPMVGIGWALGASVGIVRLHDALVLPKINRCWPNILYHLRAPKLVSKFLNGSIHYYKNLGGRGLWSSPTPVFRNTQKQRKKKKRRNLSVWGCSGSWRCIWQPNQASRQARPSRARSGGARFWFVFVGFKQKEAIHDIDLCIFFFLKIGEACKNMWGVTCSHQSPGELAACSPMEWTDRPGSSGAADATSPHDASAKAQLSGTKTAISAGHWTRSKNEEFGFLMLKWDSTGRFVDQMINSVEKPESAELPSSLKTF